MEKYGYKYRFCSLFIIATLAFRDTEDSMYIQNQIIVVRLCKVFTLWACHIWMKSTCTINLMSSILTGCLIWWVIVYLTPWRLAKNSRNIPDVTKLSAYRVFFAAFIQKNFMLSMVNKWLW